MDFDLNEEMKMLSEMAYKFAQKELGRQADLVKKHFVSASKFDDAAQSAELARQQITALELDLKRIAETLGGSVNAPIERHPSYRAALAELEQARLNLAHTLVRASLPIVTSSRSSSASGVESTRSSSVATCSAV